MVEFVCTFDIISILLELQLISTFFCILFNFFNTEHWRIRGASPAPNRTQFFRFHIRFNRETPASEVGTPQRVGALSQREILDPPLLKYSVTLLSLSIINFLNLKSMHFQSIHFKRNPCP